MFFLANILADDAPRIVQNNAIKPISMTCHDNQGFPPQMSSVPSSLFTAGKKFSLKSNQTKQANPYLAHLCGLALELYLWFICFT